MESNSKIIISIISLIVIILGYLFTCVQNNDRKIDVIRDNMGSMNISIAEMGRDISWIRDSIEKSNATAKY